MNFLDVLVISQFTRKNYFSKPCILGIILNSWGHERGGEWECARSLPSSLAASWHQFLRHLLFYTLPMIFYWGVGGRDLSTPLPGGGTSSKPIFLLSRDFLPLFFCLICSICQEITSHFFLFNFFLLFVSCFYTLNPLLIFLFKVFFFFLVSCFYT